METQMMHFSILFLGLALAHCQNKQGEETFNY